MDIQLKKGAAGGMRTGQPAAGGLLWVSADQRSFLLCGNLRIHSISDFEAAGRRQNASPPIPGSTTAGCENITASPRKGSSGFRNF